MAPTVLHLLVNTKCYNKCTLCCNKLYNIEKLPVVSVEELKTVNKVCLTGGEPFLCPNLLDLCRGIKKEFLNVSNIYVYTSGFPFKAWMLNNADFVTNDLYTYIDGITFSPKSDDDLSAISFIFSKIYHIRYVVEHLKHNRLLVFHDTFSEKHYKSIKDKLELPENTKLLGRVWDSKFTVPENEIFRRLPILLN